jgi:hypothetical protein
MALKEMKKSFKEVTRNGDPLTDYSQGVSKKNNILLSFKGQYSLHSSCSYWFAQNNFGPVFLYIQPGKGRAIAQAVSRSLPTAAVRVRSRVWSSGICGWQSGEYFGFPWQSSFHQLFHNHPRLSSGAATIGQKWPQYKGLSPTPLKKR